MTIGTADDDWWRVVTVVMHEAIEAAMMDCHCRYADTADGFHADDCFLFVMTHPQYSQVIGQASEFLTEVLPDLAKVYNANRTVSKRRRVRGTGSTKG